MPVNMRAKLLALNLVLMRSDGGAVRDLVDLTRGRVQDVDAGCAAVFELVSPAALPDTSPNEEQDHLSHQEHGTRHDEPDHVDAAGAV